MQNRSVLQAYGLRNATIEPLGNGRIHKTFLVRADDGLFVLQKVNALYTPTAPNIESVAIHLTAKHMLTPRIVRTRDGSITLAEGDSAWRLMTFIPGTTIEKASLPQAVETATCVARFHMTLLDYEKPFAYRIPGYRDTRADFERLEHVSRGYSSSPKHTECTTIVEDILARRARTNVLEGLPSRVCHGDLKLNNVRFDSDERNAVALIDLDTLGRYPLPLELGDMLRSACRTEHNTLDVDTWRAMMHAYRETADFMTHEEWSLIPEGFVEITLSLAARYLTDAYEETWFKHDPTYPSLYEQNVTRARMYLALLDNYTHHSTFLRRLHA